MAKIEKVKVGWFCEVCMKRTAVLYGNELLDKWVCALCDEDNQEDEDLDEGSCKVLRIQKKTK